MNEQQLEYIRIRLRSALLDDSGGTKGQLEAFREHPPVDKNGHVRQRLHVVELEGGRKVKAENTAVYVMETRSRRQPFPPMNEFAYAHCAWRRAVHQLNEPQQAWLKYCYGWDLSFKLQTLICQHVWEIYEKQLVGSRLQKRVKLRLISLVWLAVQDVAAKNWNDGYREYAASTLSSLMSITRETWYQTYAAPWQALKAIATNLDEEALIDTQGKVGSHYAED
ncbi:MULTISPECIES: bacteriophage antitermination protein Q [unclassified Serratia (in: enterobacteria)]|uniref:bacteriophage antitermination protein Q n=1 Tax=unclassified Serratia (in: enterobacteria) TaxID=2647522 RepID=UPI00046920AA|nr:MULTISPECIES: bacteriophage antitermination protein Q [unclassified Serratia (in: enterobacteria)]